MHGIMFHFMDHGKKESTSLLIEYISAISHKSKTCNIRFLILNHIHKLFQALFHFFINKLFYSYKDSHKANGL